MQPWLKRMVKQPFELDRSKELEWRNARKPGRLFGSPTGLGTSAARIASQFGGILENVEIGR